MGRWSYALSVMLVTNHLSQTSDAFVPGGKLSRLRTTRCFVSSFADSLSTRHDPEEPENNAAASQTQASSIESLHSNAAWAQNSDSEGGGYSSSSTEVQSGGEAEEVISGSAVEEQNIAPDEPKDYGGVTYTMPSWAKPGGADGDWHMKSPEDRDGPSGSSGSATESVLPSESVNKIQGNLPKQTQATQSVQSNYPKRTQATQSSISESQTNAGTPVIPTGLPPPRLEATGLPPPKPALSDMNVPLGPLHADEEETPWWSIANGSRMYANYRKPPALSPEATLLPDAITVEAVRDDDEDVAAALEYMDQMANDPEFQKLSPKDQIAAAAKAVSDDGMIGKSVPMSTEDDIVRIATALASKLAKEKARLLGPSKEAKEYAVKMGLMKARQEAMKAKQPVIRAPPPPQPPPKLEKKSGDIDMEVMMKMAKEMATQMTEQAVKTIVEQHQLDKGRTNEPPAVPYIMSGSQTNGAPTETAREKCSQSAESRGNGRSEQPPSPLNNMSSPPSTEMGNTRQANTVTGGQSDPLARGKFKHPSPPSPGLGIPGIPNQSAALGSGIPKKMPESPVETFRRESGGTPSDAPGTMNGGMFKNQSNGQKEPLNLTMNRPSTLNGGMLDKKSMENSESSLKNGKSKPQGLNTNGPSTFKVESFKNSMETSRKNEKTEPLKPGSFRGSTLNKPLEISGKNEFPSGSSPFGNSMLKETSKSEKNGKTEPLNSEGGPGSFDGGVVKKPIEASETNGKTKPLNSFTDRPGSFGNSMLKSPVEQPKMKGETEPASNPSDQQGGLGGGMFQKTIESRVKNGKVELVFQNLTDSTESPTGGPSSSTASLLSSNNLANDAINQARAKAREALEPTTGLPGLKKPDLVKPFPSQPGALGGGIVSGATEQSHETEKTIPPKVKDLRQAPNEQITGQSSRSEKQVNLSRSNGMGASIGSSASLNFASPMVDPVDFSKKPLNGNSTRASRSPRSDTGNPTALDRSSRKRLVGRLASLKSKSSKKQDIEDSTSIVNENEAEVTSSTPETTEDGTENPKPSFGSKAAILCNIVARAAFHI